jgi:phenylacetate-CoA ligase
MGLRNVFTENIFLPLGEKISGLPLTKNLMFLEKSQWWSKAEHEAYQNEKLRGLVEHAYKNTIYYKELFDDLGLTPSDIKNRNDLNKLPILKKDVIRENVKNGRLIANNIATNNLIIKSSSGSTGEPLKFYETKESHAFDKACIIRGWQWMGYNLGDKYVKISQYDRPIKKRVQDRLNNSVYLSAQIINNENLSKIVDGINSSKPTVIRSYPDQLKALTAYIKKNNIEIYQPSAITTTGSVLHINDRKSIEDIFDCKVFDQYSCEGGAITFECATHECYHSSMEYAITEIIHENGHAEPGEEGRVISTDLQNYATPFIRYDTQDFVKRSEQDCTCGRKLLAIEKIKGRDSDILITPKGQKLISHEFSVYFQKFKSIEQFQVIQRSLDSLVFRLKTSKNLSETEKHDILNYWTNYVGKSMLISIEEVESIPLNSSGKRRYLIRDKSIRLTL